MNWLQKIIKWLKTSLFNNVRKKKLGDFWVEEQLETVACPEPDTLQDKVTLSLAGLDICLSRKMEIDLPHEVTVVVPRAEIRKKCPTPNCPDCQLEIILNSITIAHSPRPLEEEGAGNPFLENIMNTAPQEEANSNNRPTWTFTPNR